MELDIRTLVDKLNPVCREALQDAAALCVANTHYNIEVEHLLLKLLEVADGDVARILRYYEVTEESVARDLTSALDKLKRGASRNPAFSEQVVELFEQGLLASLKLGEPKVRSGALLLGLLESKSLRGLVVESCPPIGKLNVPRLREDIRELIRGSVEDQGVAFAPPGLGLGAGALASQPVGQGSRAAPGTPTKTPSLDQYTIDLTARARAGDLDPIHGRDGEIRQIVDILTRRRQNNPILTGEAGVGKTAVVEGFAMRIASGDVPPPLRNVSLRVLDIGLLQAGAGVKGEFENRLKSVIAEVKASPQPVILFIDEAHTIIGAGGQAGQSDAANLLKPALARGELRTIAATTWSEYKQYFEKDAALARRFQVIQVDEPDETRAIDMLRTLLANLERHHRVLVLDEAVRDAVRLSHRYISGRQLPDKAVSVLDTACARVAIGQTSTPPRLEDCNRRGELLRLELGILERERRTGADHGKRVAELEAELSVIAEERKALEARWQRELDLVGRIGKLQAEAAAEPGGVQGEARAELGRLKEELSREQGEEPMVPLCVDGRVVAGVVAGWTGIPVGKMMTDEVGSLLDLEARMAERIVGQAQALEAICQRIRTARAGLDDPVKPVGVFLLVGPSGVGKTETGLALADLLYGGEDDIVGLNMSEFQEPHTVSLLKGAPPGYVGYGKGGVLTEAVRRDPYTVVLLDEIEKAHPDVVELFYQVFDKGRLEDAEGIVVDFRNTVILLTCNLGADAILRACKDAKRRPDAARLVELVRPTLVERFKPAFLGRLVVVPYYPLGDREIREVVVLKLAKIQRRFRDNHRAELTYGEELVEAVAARCTEVDSGARNIDHILTRTLLPELSVRLLEHMAKGEAFTGVHVGVGESGEFRYQVRGG